MDNDNQENKLNTSDYLAKKRKSKRRSSILTTIQNITRVDDDFDDPQLMEKIAMYQNKWLKEQIQTVNSFIENSKFEELHNTNIDNVDLHISKEEYDLLNNEQKTFLMEHDINENELKKAQKRFEHMRIKLDLLGAKLRVKDFKGLEKTHISASELDESIKPNDYVLLTKINDPKQILLDYFMSE